MTETLFYHLERRALDDVLPGLIEKTLERGWRAVIRAETSAALAFGMAVLWTGGAQAAIPTLTPAEMNCADVKATQDSGLNREQGHLILEHLKPVFQLKAKKAGRTVGGLEAYMVAFCGVTRHGQKYIVLDGIYRFMGALICDDDAGFGVIYDPRTRSFGDLTFGVSSCARAPKAAP